MIADELRKAKEERRFLQLLVDFGTMSGGQFRKKYPDQQPYEGYRYIQKKAEAKLAGLDRAIAEAQDA